MCVLTWRIPGTGEPGGLPPMGSHRVGHDLAAAAAGIRWVETVYFCGGVFGCFVLVAAHGLLSSCGLWASEPMGSVVVAGRLSCHAAREILVPPPGINSVFSILEGRFLTNDDQGSPCFFQFPIVEV